MNKAELRRELARLVKNVGRVPMDEAREWVVQNAKDSGLGDDQINLILSYGYSGHRKLWRREGQDLIWWGEQEIPSTPSGNGTGAATSVVEKPPVPQSPQRSEAQPLTELGQQFYDVGIQLGVSEKDARPVAYYVSANYDLGNPESVWNGLAECRQITQSSRKAWWRTWVSFTDAPVPEGLERRVNLPSVEVAGQMQRPLQPANLTRRFIAISGEVMPTDPDDPGGLSFAEALRVAALQNEKFQRADSSRASSDSGTTSLINTIVTEQGATERKRMELEAERKQGGVSEVSTILEMQRRESEARLETISKEGNARMDAIKQENALRLEMLQQSHAHQMEMLAKSLQDISAAVSHRRNPIEDLDNSLPGLGKVFTGLLEKALNPPAAQPAFVFRLPDGQDMTLDLFKELKKMEKDDKLIVFAKEAVDKLVGATIDFTAAINRDSQQDAQGALPPPDAVETPPRTTLVCAGGECGETLTYNVDAKVIICPACQTVQTTDGRRLVPYAPPSAAQGQTDEQPVPSGNVSNIPSPVKEEEMVTAEVKGGMGSG